MNQHPLPFLLLHTAQRELWTRDELLQALQMSPERFDGLLDGQLAADRLSLTELRSMAEVLRLPPVLLMVLSGRLQQDDWVCPGTQVDTTPAWLSHREMALGLAVAQQGDPSPVDVNLLAALQHNLAQWGLAQRPVTWQDKFDAGPDIP
ncbi:hypothetical protein OL229_16230 [Neisseriaceae bacterium JH1-16]|nr:hypothetical protein [Neisseriaceae bacterium JH1-16]